MKFFGHSPPWNVPSGEEWGKSRPVIWHQTWIWTQTILLGGDCCVVVTMALFVKFVLPIIIIVVFVSITYRITKPEKTTFHLLHLSLFREYIDWEFSELKVLIKSSRPALHQVYQSLWRNHTCDTYLCVCVLYTQSVLSLSIGRF